MCKVYSLKAELSLKLESKAIDLKEKWKDNLVEEI